MVGPTGPIVGRPLSAVGGQPRYTFGYYVKGVAPESIRADAGLIIGWL